MFLVAATEEAASKDTKGRQCRCLNTNKNNQSHASRRLHPSTATQSIATRWYHTGPFVTAVMSR